MTRVDIYRRSNLSKPRQHVLAFLQSWLFFGLLTEVLQREICVEDFVVIGLDGEQFMTTETMPAITFEWIKHIRNLGDEEKRQRFENTRAILSEARSVLAHLPIYSPQLLDPTLSISLAAIGEYLILATSAAFVRADLNVPRWIPVLPSDDLFSLRMRAQGWCPSEIGMLRKKTNIETMYYVSNLNRPGDKDHDACNLDKCVAYQIASGAYETKHNDMSCTGPACRHVHADQGHMLDILRRGSISLLLYDALCETGPKLHLLDSGRVSHYVAISYVWSDGMGNNISNSLPQCQLDYLSKIVNDLYPQARDPAPFWMDTICFPLEPPEAYNLATEKMRETYEDADEVLVLDSYLRTQPRGQLSNEECLIRIYCSGWMRRLWTLQEGILASAL